MATTPQLVLFHEDAILPLRSVPDAGFRDVGRRAGSTYLSSSKLDGFSCVVSFVRSKHPLSLFYGHHIHVLLCCSLLSPVLKR